MTNDQYSTPTEGTPPNPYAQNPTQPYGYAPAAPPQGLSIASLICGIAGLFIVPVAGSIAALIMGYMAKKQQPYARPLWLTGIITGWVGVGLGILGIIGAILWFVFVAAAISNGVMSEELSNY